MDAYLRKVDDITFKVDASLIFAVKFTVDVVLITTPSQGINGDSVIMPTVDDISVILVEIDGESGILPTVSDESGVQ